MTSSPAFSAVCTMVSNDSLTNTPTLCTDAGRELIIPPSFSGVICRLLDANTNPMKSAPALAARCAASGVVMPQILTRTGSDPFLNWNLKFIEHARYIISPHHGFPDQDCTCTIFGYPGHILLFFHAAFTDDGRLRIGHHGGQAFGGFQIDIKRFQIAVVDADNVST